jgi:hypothetical protein
MNGTWPGAGIIRNDEWEVQDATQPRFVQCHVEFDDSNLSPLLEAYCLHAIFNDCKQGVRVFRCSRTDYEGVCWNLLAILERC